MVSVSSFDPNLSLGALEIGVLLSYVLFGVSTTQCYIYFNRFPDDSRRLKVLTAFVWVSQLSQTLCLGNVLYTLTISDYGHSLTFPNFPRVYYVSVLFSGFTVACVHSFFAFRIYAFTKKAYIPGLVWFMALLQLLGRIGVLGTAFHTTSIEGLITETWLTTLNWSISVASDVTIATTMVVVLRSQRAHAYSKTAAIVDRLIVWTIGTGLLNSVSSSLMLFCFVMMKDNYVWLTFYAIATALFPNSLMANLNSRATLRAMDQISLSLPAIPAAASFGSERQIQLPANGSQLEEDSTKNQDGYQGSSDNFA